MSPTVACPACVRLRRVHAAPAEPLCRHCPAGLGHSHGPDRSAAGSWRGPSSRAQAEHRQPVDGDAGGAGCDRTHPEQHRHLPDRVLVCRARLDCDRRRTGRDARRRHGNQPDGRGLFLRPVLAVSPAHRDRRDPLHVTAGHHGRARRAGHDRSGAHYPGVAAHRVCDPADDPVTPGAKPADRAAE